MKKEKPSFRETTHSTPWRRFARWAAGLNWKLSFQPQLEETRATFRFDRREIVVRGCPTWCPLMEIRLEFAAFDANGREVGDDEDIPSSSPPPCDEEETKAFLRQLTLFLEQTGTSALRIVASEGPDHASRGTASDYRIEPRAMRTRSVPIEFLGVCRAVSANVVGRARPTFDRTETDLREVTIDGLVWKGDGVDRGGRADENGFPPDTIVRLRRNPWAHRRRKAEKQKSALARDFFPVSARVTSD